MFRWTTERAAVRILEADAIRFAISSAWDAPTMTKARAAAATTASMSRIPAEVFRRLRMPRRLADGGLLAASESGWMEGERVTVECYNCEKKHFACRFRWAVEDSFAVHRIRGLGADGDVRTASGAGLFLPQNDACAFAVDRSIACGKEAEPMQLSTT